MDVNSKRERQGASNGDCALDMNGWQRKYRVLIADDCAEHCIMLACAMRRTRFLQTMHTVNTGREAMRYFLGHGQYADRLRFPFPEVLVTDLGMPCLETLRLLAAMGTEGFQVPLRIVLTDSPEREHRREAARLGADAYFIKPRSFYGLVNIVQQIECMLEGVEPAMDVKEPVVRRA
jgi:CheY-like chemotaxis protein